MISDFTTPDAAGAETAQLPADRLPVTGEGTRAAAQAGGPGLTFQLGRAEAEWLARNVDYAEQQRVRLLLHALRMIHAEKKKRPACRRLAAQLQARAEFQGMRGLGMGTLVQKYYLYLRTGDWRVALNGSKVRGKQGLPGPFIEWFRMWCERSQRVTTEAIREVHLIWGTRHTSAGKAVAAIPGYAEWPAADPATGLPEGWTAGNLAKHAPDKFELLAARIGRKAAGALKLKKRNSRAGLQVGEFYEFDDHEFNLITPYPGSKKILRPRGFGVVDVLSGCLFSHLIKPTLWDEGAEKKKVLTELDFMWFVVSVLTGEGYRDDDTGTTLVVEHGTAAIRAAFEARILDATRGRVRIARSGIHEHTAHGAQLGAAGGGNFRFKAHIEGFWRLIDDRLALLAGQVGKDRDHAPEELTALRNHTRDLLHAAGGMRPEHAAQLQLPVVLYPQFVRFAGERFEAINRDRNHQLEGWAKLGFFLKAWRADAAEIEWRTEAEFLALPEPERLALAPRIARTPALQGALRMSRREVWQRHRGELTRLGLVHLPALLGPQHAVRGGEPLTVRHGELEFDNWEISPEPLRYVAGDGAQRFPEGEKYVCFVNPFRPDALVACDAKLRVVAVCPPVTMPARNDTAANERHLGEVARWEARALAPQRARHAEREAELDFMRRHNERVIADARAGRPVTPEEKAAAREEARRVRECPVTLADLNHLSAVEEPADDGNEDKLAALRLLRGQTTKGPQPHEH